MRTTEPMANPPINYQQHTNPSEQKKHEKIHQWNMSHPKGKQGRLN